jgi:RNA polymerase sigma-70 factor, ECF subfamily
MSPSSSSAALFLSFLPSRRLDAGGLEGPLAKILDEMLEEARARWPALEHAAEGFLRTLADGLPESAAPDAHLRSLCAADLYLASACAQGNPKAMEAFEATYFGDLDSVLAEAGTPPHIVDDVKQVLRERFFVSREGRAPLIATYTGRGSLRAWVRISALREVYRHGDAQKRWVFLEEERMEQVAAPGDDPELGFLKERFRGEFRQAFAEGMRSLTARQRNLLRHHYLDGMTIDQLGVLYHVHRSTTARWLEHARQELLTQTRGALMQRLSLDPAELESLIRLIESQLDVTLQSFLVTSQGSIESG